MGASPDDTAAISSEQVKDVQLAILADIAGFGRDLHTNWGGRGVRNAAAAALVNRLQYALCNSRGADVRGKAVDVLECDAAAGGWADEPRHLQSGDVVVAE